jgi:hypothetical protein
VRARAIAVLVALVGVFAAGTAAAAPPQPTTGTAPKWLTTLPGDKVQFSAFDFRQDDFGPVDWPVEFVFRGNATPAKIADALCHQTADKWHYCNEGGPMHLFQDDESFTGFVANSGLKRFREDCQSMAFTAHMRMYAPHDGLASTYGSLVIATTHLDFEDHTGCSGRIHGDPDIAEQWFITALSTIPGWTVTPHRWDLGNGSDAYVIMRDLGGALVPHVYGHDAFATDVVVP